MTNIIELRGHHLKNLCVKYLEPEYKESLYLHYGVECGKEILNDILKEQIKNYDANFANSSDNIYTFLVQNPDQKVKITDTYEKICKACPPKKREDCPNTPSLDNEIARVFGLNIGKNYEIKEILQRFELWGRTFLRKEKEKMEKIK